MKQNFFKKFFYNLKHLWPGGLGLVHFIYSHKFSTCYLIFYRNGFTKIEIQSPDQRWSLIEIFICSQTIQINKIKFKSVIFFFAKFFLFIVIFEKILF